MYCYLYALMEGLAPPTSHWISICRMWRVQKGLYKSLGCLFTCCHLNIYGSLMAFSPNVHRFSSAHYSQAGRCALPTNTTTFLSTPEKVNNASPEKPVCFLRAFAPAERLTGSRWLGKGSFWWMVCNKGWVPHITRAAAAHVTEIKSLRPLATGSWCLATDEPGGSVDSVRWPQGETLEMMQGRG